MRSNSVAEPSRIRTELRSISAWCPQGFSNNFILAVAGRIIVRNSAKLVTLIKPIIIINIGKIVV